MTEMQHDVLLCVLGLNVEPKPCKNYFFSSDGDQYWADCLALESMGYLQRKQPGSKPPDVEFNATVDGIQFAMGLVQREAIERWMATGTWGKRKAVARQ